MSRVVEIVKSWKDTEGTVNSMSEISDWVASRYDGLKVSIEKIDFSYNGFWYYDEENGYIRNRNNSFFQLAGYQEIEDDQIINEQPVIIQDEIGYLGIICKNINGRLNFLMQSKIEPGNVNKIQISPTIQATKSNFTRMHGGKSPAYLEYFVNATQHEIIVDQIQSEQSSRFYKKRNRNIIIYVEDDIEVEKSHMWMTLGQIKELMKIDNLVNMDTRTVLSCIPFSDKNLTREEKEEIKPLFSDESFYRSIFESEDDEQFQYIFNQINDQKMYRKENSRLVPIKSMKGWEVKPTEICCKSPYDFKVIYCHIEIEGREVKYWEQPLIEAMGEAVFGLFTTVRNGVRKFLVCVKPEIGCFDTVEIGPTIQLEPTNPRNNINKVERLFLNKYSEKEDIMIDVILSEEGGRFYHEQNKNVVIEVSENEMGSLPKGYFWLDFATLNKMVQYNNCLNIQLRNVLSLLNI